MRLFLRQRNPFGGFFLKKYRNSKPVADFYCGNCSEDYELKSKKTGIGKKIVDGAYETMIQRLTSSNNPNFFLLNYHPSRYEVRNLFVVPKHFLLGMDKSSDEYRNELKAHFKLLVFTKASALSLDTESDRARLLNLFWKEMECLKML